jgi:hypothetical protein
MLDPALDGAAFLSPTPLLRRSNSFNLNLLIVRTLSTLRFCTGPFVRTDRLDTDTDTDTLAVAFSRFDQTSSLTLSSRTRSRRAVETARQPHPCPILYYASSVELRASPTKRLSVISTIIQPEPITQALGKFEISFGNTPHAALGSTHFKLIRLINFSR